MKISLKISFPKKSSVPFYFQGAPDFKKKKILITFYLLPELWRFFFLFFFLSWPMGLVNRLTRRPSSDKIIRPFRSFQRSEQSHSLRSYDWRMGRFRVHVMTSIKQKRHKNIVSSHNKLLRIFWGNILFSLVKKY